VIVLIIRKTKIS